MDFLNSNLRNDISYLPQFEYKIYFIYFHLESFTYDAMFNGQMKDAFNIFNGGMPYVEFSAMHCQKYSLQICCSQCL